jgi:TRAP-type C4-dicarboxylate transport system permease small subunit
VSDRGKTIMRIAGNGLLVITFAISFKPSLDFVIFQGYKHSSVLFLPMNVVSSAYLVFLVDVTIRYLVSIVKDIRTLGTRRPA